MYCKKATIQKRIEGTTTKNALFCIDVEVMNVIQAWTVNC